MDVLSPLPLACSSCFMVQMDATVPGFFELVLRGVPLAALAWLMARHYQGAGRFFSNLFALLAVYIISVALFMPLALILLLVLSVGLVGILVKGPAKARALAVAGLAALVLLPGLANYRAKSDPMVMLDRLPASDHMIMVAVARGTLPLPLQPRDVVSALNDPSPERAAKAYLLLQALAGRSRGEERASLVAALQNVDPTAPETVKQNQAQLLELYGSKVEAPAAAGQGG